MSKFNQNELAKMCGIDRETAKRHLDGHKWEQGPKGAKVYEGADVLMIRPAGGGEGEAVSQSEATRQLTVKRTQQIDLEMEVTRKQRITLDAIEANNDKVFSNVAGLLKAHNGKPLDDALIHDIFTELRGISDCLKDGPA